MGAPSTASSTGHGRRWSGLGRGLDVDWTKMVQAALALGLVDSKDLSFGPEEYGTRFVWRLQRR